MKKILSIFLFLTSASFAQNIGITSNTIKQTATMKVVINVSDLYNALLTSKPHDTVYVAAGSYDLSLFKNIPLNKGLTLTGSVAAVLYTNTTYPYLTYTSLFKTTGDSVTIYGLKIHGNTPDIGTTDYNTYGVQNGITTLHANCKIINCEIWAFNFQGIWASYYKDIIIEHCFIHHCALNGYGYGAWLGGSGSQVGSNGTIDSNLFTSCRHDIAAQGNCNSMTIHDNVFFGRQTYIPVDMHDSLANWGGYYVSVYHNWFICPNQPYLLHISNCGGLLSITNNYFQNPNGMINGVYYYNVDTPQVNVLNNNLIYIPDNTVSIKCDSLSKGRYKFTAIGKNIAWCIWHFHNKGDAYGSEVRALTSTQTFNKGIYRVELTVFNKQGLPTTVTKDITVPGNSLWIKNTEHIKGLAQISIYVNDTMFWTGDGTGVLSWRQFFLPDWKINKVLIKYCSTDTINQYCYIDDVSCMPDGYFDTISGYWRSTTGTVSEQYTVEDYHSAPLCWRFRVLENCGDIYQEKK